MRDCTSAEVTAEVGLALCDAMAAWRSEDFARAVADLSPVRSKVQRIGGSHAQRDLVTQILMASAIGAGRYDLAREALTERVVAHPNNLETWRLYAGVLEQLGDGSAAGARTRATVLAGHTAAV
jgi:alkyl sulfatase BDS1-like metallo-beta-lactamase superfamily hydrolase